MITIKRWAREVRDFLGGKRRSRGLPSLVKGLDRLVPRAVLREVVASSNDRRQWGVLAAAWVGVSEKEFTIAAAQELGIDFHERVPVPELQGDLIERRSSLAAFRKVGAVPVVEGGEIVRFVAVDPAEVRALPLYDERLPIGVATWSDIARALDTADRRLAEEESQQDRGALEQRTKLTESLVETILQEAAAHGARSVEIVFSDERSRYQFTTRDGRCGVGNIRRDVVVDIAAFLGRFQGACYISSKRGEVLVRSLGATGNVKLSWGDRELLNHEPVSSDAVASVGLQGLGEIDSDFSESPWPIPVNAPDERVPLVEDRGMTPEGVRVPILVVDDNPMFCRVLERLLERDGFEPHFAANGAAAWEWLSRATAFRPRAIVCDLHMPIMNGQELLDKVRSEQRFGAVPFIMLTSDDDVNAELSLLARGADAFVSKSKDPRVLCAQIRRLSQRAALQEAA